MGGNENHGFGYFSCFAISFGGTEEEVISFLAPVSVLRCGKTAI